MREKGIQQLRVVREKRPFGVAGGEHHRVLWGRSEARLRASRVGRGAGWPGAVLAFSV
jgi:hypothetical protein